MTKDEVLGVEMTPGWWGRALYYLHVAREEPVGVVLAMQFTQEGQMPAFNAEIVLPALETHYGIKRTDRAAIFFAEHEMADEEHSSRQLALAAKYLDTPELKARAEEREAHAEELAAQEKKAKQAPKSRGRQRQSVGEAAIKSLVRSISSSVGRRIARGILGSLFGK